MRKSFLIALTIFILTLGIFIGCSKEGKKQELNTFDISSIVNEDYEVKILNMTDIYESSDVN